MKKYDTLKEKMPELQLNIPLRCKFYRSNPGRTFGAHWHDRLEILLVHEGCLIVEIDGDPHTVNAGQAAVFSPCQVHAARSSNEGAVYQMLMFDLSLLRNNTPAVKNLIERLLGTVVSFEKVIDDERLRRYAQLIEKEFESVPSPVTTQGYIYLVLGLLAENYLIESASARFTASDKISAVTDFITVHYRQPLTTEKLSRMFGYTEAYFCRRFKRETGFTPMQYLRITRLERAKKLLSLSMRVSDAASQCGFTDAVYFAKCFKNQYGMTPGEYATNKLEAKLENDLKN